MVRLILALLIFVAAPTSGETSMLPLRVGVTVEFEPMTFEVSGELQGIEIDLARRVAAEIGRDVEFRVYPFPRLIDALTSRDIDIVMAGMSITAARATRVRFTDPYMEIGQMAIVRVADADRLAAPNALSRSGIRIGAHLGSTGEVYVVEQLPEANLIAYPSVEAGLQALREGNLDAFIHDSITSWQLSRSFVNDNLLSLNRFLTREELAWAIHPDDAELQTMVNLVLEDLKAEGVVSEIVSEWLPMIPIRL